MTLALPILLMAIGSGWLLTNSGFMPGIDWVWTLLLAAVGVLILVLGGINKLTITLGPVSIAASFLSILRQNGKLSMDIEIPLLMILLGFCMLVARHPRIPAPPWALPSTPPEKGSR
jgi:hypothetical protein